MMNRFSHLIFDYDGTLINNKDAFLHTLSDTIKEFGKEVPNNIEKCYGLTEDAIFSFFELNSQIKKTFFQQWYNKMIHSDIALFDGIREALQKLSDYGYELGILSSRKTEYVRASLSKHGISHLFTVINGAEFSTVHKPNPQPLYNYLSHNNLRSEQVLYIGDLTTDEICANAAGVAFAYAGWSRTMSHTIFDSIDEMMEMLL